MEQKDTRPAKKSLKPVLIRLKKKSFGTKKRKIISSLVAAGIILTVIIGIPYTRTHVVGLVIKKTITVSVVDSQKNAPVSHAKVSIDGVVGETDKDGSVTLSGVRPGLHRIEVKKELYKNATTSVSISVFGDKKESEITLEATGRLIPITVTHAITGEPIANAIIDAGKDNKASTNDKGIAQLVIPAHVSELTVSVSAEGFATSQDNVISQDKEATVQLAPSGHIYFLSRMSGTIDVVRTNLDGTDRKVVLAGTGNEDQRSTVLLASRDWRYLVLLAKREANEALYLINTETDELTLIDQAPNAETTFRLTGWSGHHFIYMLTRDKPDWEAGKQALKSYDASNRKLFVIDETAAGFSGLFSSTYDSAWNSMQSVYILKDDQIVYTKTWDGAKRHMADQVDVITSISADGSSKKVLKSYKAVDIGFIEAKLYTPQNIHFRVWGNSNDRIENVQTVSGAIIPVPPAEQKFDQNYPTFLISPDGRRSFWADPRDGKNALFVGDNDATNESTDQLAALSEYTAYGWFTDQYLLLQKNNSELYITTPDQLKKVSEGHPPLKISDYHKSELNFDGYGYGYGGR